MNDRMDDAAGAQRVEVEDAWRRVEAAVQSHAAFHERYKEPLETCAFAACVLWARLRAVEGERDHYAENALILRQGRDAAQAEADTYHQKLCLEIERNKAAEAEARRLRAISTRLHEWMQQPMSYDETSNLIVTRGQRLSLMAIVEALTPPRPVKHEHGWPTCWRGCQPPESCVDCRQDV